MEMRHDRKLDREVSGSLQMGEARMTYTVGAPRGLAAVTKAVRPSDGSLKCDGLM
jgi:hypothetical protein